MANANSTMEREREMRISKTGVAVERLKKSDDKINLLEGVDVKFYK